MDAKIILHKPYRVRIIHIGEESSSVFLNLYFQNEKFAHDFCRGFNNDFRCIERAMPIKISIESGEYRGTIFANKFRNYASLIGLVLFREEKMRDPLDGKKKIFYRPNIYAEFY